MKAMKFVGLATLAVMTLGFATQASATEGVKTTDITVEVEESSTFTLEAVPSAYNFSTPVLNGGAYTGLEAEITDGTIEVFKGYDESDGRTISVSISDLEVDRADVADIAVTELSIAGVDLLGTGSGILFADDDFEKNAAGDAQTTGHLVNDIDAATIGFTAEVLPGDTLTGTVMYTVNNAG